MPSKSSSFSALLDDHSSTPTKTLPLSDVDSWKEYATYYPIKPDSVWGYRMGYPARLTRTASNNHLHRNCSTMCLGSKYSGSRLLFGLRLHNRCGVVIWICSHKHFNWVENYALTLFSATVPLPPLLVSLDESRRETTVVITFGVEVMCEFFDGGLGYYVLFVSFPG